MIIGIAFFMFLLNSIQVEASSNYWAPQTELKHVEVLVSSKEAGADTHSDDKAVAGDTKANIDEKQNNLIQEARKYLGVPYIWGGSTPQGFDCSGLVQYVYARCGKQLPRVTTQQEKCGDLIPLNQVQAGDLYFWGTPGQSYHVALACGQDQFIQAPSPGQNVMVSDVHFFKPDFAIRLR